MNYTEWTNLSQCEQKALRLQWKAQSANDSVLMLGVHAVAELKQAPLSGAVVHFAYLWDDVDAGDLIICVGLITYQESDVAMPDTWRGFPLRIVGRDGMLDVYRVRWRGVLHSLVELPMVDLVGWESNLLECDEDVVFHYTPDSYTAAKLAMNMACVAGDDVGTVSRRIEAQLATMPHAHLVGEATMLQDERASIVQRLLAGFSAPSATTQTK